MDFHCEAILAQYRANIDSYNKIKEIVVTELKKITDSLNMLPNSIEARVKTEKSLAGKLELKGHKYKDASSITDLVGARVVTFYKGEIDLVAAKITSRFDIDWDNSIDKRKLHKFDQFGYSSLHFISRIPKTLYYDENHPEINEIRFEIQIRTVLQHTWASIYHDTGYKNDVEVPSEYLRSLSRLAGLLEIADNEFNDIKISLDQYRKKIKELVSSGDLEEVELNYDSFVAYCDRGRFDDLNKLIASIHNMDIEVVSNRTLLQAFKRIGFTTLKDLEELIKNHSDNAYKLCILQFEDTDLDIVSSLIGPISLIFVYCLSKGCRENELVQVLEDIYGTRKSNPNFAKRLVSYGKTMGLVKD